MKHLIVVFGENGEQIAIDMGRVTAIAEGEVVQQVFLRNEVEPLPVTATFADLLRYWREAVEG